MQKLLGVFAMALRGLIVMCLCGAGATHVNAVPLVPTPGAAASGVVHRVQVKKTPPAVQSPVTRPSKEAAQPAQPTDGPPPLGTGDPDGRPAFDEAWAKAKTGDLDAMSSLADYVGRGWGVSQSLVESRRWYQRRLEAVTQRAEQGDLDALWGIANSYQFGNNGIEADPEKYKFWKQRYTDTATRKATAGDAGAMVKLAEALEDSDEASTPDYAAAVSWWQKAADAGNFDAMARLADKYDEGTDVPADRAKAFEWYVKAGNDPTNPLRSHRELAQKYKTGDGTVKNLAEAARLHVALAEQDGGWRKRMRAESYAHEVSRSEIGYRQAVQKELASRGLYNGPVDGSVTPELGAAIKAVWRRLDKDKED